MQNFDLSLLLLLLRLVHRTESLYLSHELHNCNKTLKHIRHNHLLETFHWQRLHNLDNSYSNKRYLFLFDMPHNHPQPDRQDNLRNYYYSTGHPRILDYKTHSHNRCIPALLNHSKHYVCHHHLIQG